MVRAGDGQNGNGNGKCSGNGKCNSNRNRDGTYPSEVCRRMRQRAPPSEMAVDGWKAGVR
jgi:hypothetical protein